MPTRRASVNEVQSPVPIELPGTGEVADRLHSAAIHLLRRLRREDDASNVSAERLSALSVLVFGGPRSLGELADAERVRPPTMTRIVNALEEQRLVVRERDPDDARRTSIRATPRARAILTDGRARRVASLRTALEAIPQAERDALAGVVGVLERVIQML